MQYRKPWLTVSECLRYVKLNRPRPISCHAAMLATWVSMPPFRGGHACPGTLELKIVSNRVRRDVAGRAVDAAAVAGRRSAEIEPLDWRACSRWHGVGAVNPKVRWDIGAHALCDTNLVEIEACEFE